MQYQWNLVWRGRYRGYAWRCPATRAIRLLVTTGAGSSIAADEGRHDTHFEWGFPKSLFAAWQADLGIPAASRRNRDAYVASTRSYYCFLPRYCYLPHRHRREARSYRAP